jgi:hypothetical protein
VWVDKELSHDRYGWVSTRREEGELGYHPETWYLAGEQIGSARSNPGREDGPGVSSMTSRRLVARGPADGTGGIKS